MQFVVYLNETGADVAQNRALKVVRLPKSRQNLVRFGASDNSQIIVPEDIWEHRLVFPVPCLETWECTYLKSGNVIDSVEIVAGMDGGLLRPFRVEREAFELGVRIAGFSREQMVTVNLSRAGALCIKEWRLTMKGNIANIETKVPFHKHITLWDGKSLIERPYVPAVVAVKAKAAESEPSDDAHYIFRQEHQRRDGQDYGRPARGYHQSSATRRDQRFQR